MSLCYYPGEVIWTRNKKHAGLYEIAVNAEVILGSTPGPYRTVLYDKRSLSSLGSIASNQDGTYKFTHLTNDSDKFFIVSFDNPDGTANMGASDTLELSLMAVPVF
jgi:hypothetical protein